MDETDKHCSVSPILCQSWVSETGPGGPPHQSCHSWWCSQSSSVSSSSSSPDGVLDAAAHVTTKSLTSGGDHGSGGALTCRQHGQAHVSMCLRLCNISLHLPTHQGEFISWTQSFNEQSLSSMNTSDLQQQRGFWPCRGGRCRRCSCSRWRGCSCWTWPAGHCTGRGNPHQ